MKKIFALLLVSSFLFAKIDYSQMSNEELIALIGYVLPKNQKEFDDELEKRKKGFNKEELESYKKATEKKDDNSTS